jgi:hypothetical protein
MEKSKEKETHRQAYIRLLSRPPSSDHWDGSDLNLLGELIEADLLTGGATRGNAGTFLVATPTGLTVDGRLFLQRLEQEEKESKPMHKVLKLVPLLVGYIFGFLSPFATDLLRWALHIPSPKF